MCYYRRTSLFASDAGEFQLTGVNLYGVPSLSPRRVLAVRSRLETHRLFRVVTSQPPAYFKRAGFVFTRRAVSPAAGFASGYMASSLSVRKYRSPNTGLPSIYFICPSYPHSRTTAIHRL